MDCVILWGTMQMLWISSGKLNHLSKETRMKRKMKAFVKIKLVLVNIRFRLDISMSVVVTNPSIRFGAWQLCSLNLTIQLFSNFINTNMSPYFWNTMIKIWYMNWSMMVTCHMALWRFSYPCSHNLTIRLKLCSLDYFL